MILNNRFVVDINIFISQLLWPTSVPAKALREALSSGVLLISEATLQELADVLARKKFDPYLTLEERQSFILQLSFIAELVSHIVSLEVCRDPKDNKFLNLAISGHANFILTGDNDLLVLDFFRGVRILSCSTYLENH